MLLANKADTAADRLWIFGLAVLLPIVAMLLLGFDASWDLRNYHLYDVHAWFTGRMDTDIAPAQLQSWHNPLLDVPLYLIVTSGLSPRWASAWLTVPTIVALYFLLRLHQVLSNEPPTRTSQAVLALLALTGAATYSALGLSMNDGFVAAGVLGSLWLVLGKEHPHANSHWFAAGLVAGAIAGLKLTAFFYCIGLACSALASPGWKKRLQRLCRLAAGGVIGFVTTYGYWGWLLWKKRENPFFPYYNNIFNSPDALPVPWADLRFRPESLLDALLSPIHLLFRSQRFSELTLSDPRLLAGIVGLTLLYFLHRRSAAAARDRFAILLVFFVSSFLIWILQYGIYRYAIALELIGCLALVVLLHRLPRGRTVALLLVFLLVSADTKRPNWGRVKVSAPGLGMIRTSIEPDALIVIASGEPMAYFALALPDDVPLVAVANNMMSPDRDMRLQLQAEQRIRAHTGPILLLTTEEDRSGQGQALLERHFGLRQGGACSPLVSTIGRAALCPQLRGAGDKLPVQRQP